MSEANNNFNMSGDEARLLMAALVYSDVSAPASLTLKLYFRLVAISTAQPPQTKNDSLLT